MARQRRASLTDDAPPPRVREALPLLLGLELTALAIADVAMSDDRAAFRPVQRDHQHLPPPGRVRPGTQVFQREACARSLQDRPDPHQRWLGLLNAALRPMPPRAAPASPGRSSRLEKLTTSPRRLFSPAHGNSLARIDGGRASIPWEREAYSRSNARPLPDTWASAARSTSRLSAMRARASRIASVMSLLGRPANPADTSDKSRSKASRPFSAASARSRCRMTAARNISETPVTTITMKNWIEKVCTASSDPVNHSS